MTDASGGTAERFTNQPGINTDVSANGGLGAWGIRIAAIGGTTTPTLSNVRTLIDDGQINSKPAWSLDGSAIYFHRLDFAEEASFGLFKIRADGTQTRPTRLTAVGTGVNEFPSN